MCGAPEGGREIRQALVKGAADVEWYLAGASYTENEDDLARVGALPRRVRQLTALASGSHVKPEVSIKAFEILEPL